MDVWITLDWVRTEAPSIGGEEPTAGSVPLPQLFRFYRVDRTPPGDGAARLDASPDEAERWRRAGTAYREALQDAETELARDYAAESLRALDVGSAAQYPLESLLRAAQRRYADATAAATEVYLPVYEEIERRLWSRDPWEAATSLPAGRRNGRQVERGQPERQGGGAATGGGAGVDSPRHDADPNAGPDSSTGAHHPTHGAGHHAGHHGGHDGGGHDGAGHDGGGHHGGHDGGGFGISVPF